MNESKKPHIVFAADLFEEVDRFLTIKTKGKAGLFYRRCDNIKEDAIVFAGLHKRSTGILLLAEDYIRGANPTFS